jgi:ABC-type cobalamin transport system permease subunit
VLGAVQDTATCSFPAIPVTPVGAEGTVAGVTEALAPEGTEDPTEFVATTVNVYAWPLVKPRTVAVVPLLVAVNPPGLEVTVYSIMTDPPVLGAVQETATCSFPAIPDTPVGAEGTVTGVTEGLGAEGTEDPTEFVATTVNVYAWPLVNPKTVAVVPLVVAVSPSGLEVTVYCVIAKPSVIGAVQDTVTCWFPEITVTAVGGPGAT